MKIERGYPTYTVTPKAENAIVKGHPWVYDAEILSVEGETANGGLVDVISRKGRYLGTGFLSQQSKIRVRLISRNANDRFDEAFWRRKLQWAWDYRKSVMDPADLDACRVIFGEADAFPGLTVDRFESVLVAQVRSVKEMGSRHFVLIDAGFNDLMRPSMYGSYHHITALAADGRDLVNAPRIETVVAGPLCESGDVFTQQEGGKVETRSLPEVKPGDYLVLHDTGAYGASMSSNYNSRPLLPEVLFDNGVARLIRRRQTIQELLALELV